MAAARDRGENRYDDGSGGGDGFGKFRKRSFHRKHATPYDRPPSAVRSLAASASGVNNGWLSRLVDPARRLLTSSAHRLFSSVKRLPPLPPLPLPQPPETETQQGAELKQKESVATDSHGTGEAGAATNVHDNPIAISEVGGLSELELLLKQKTFTRSEIDRLTALLQSRIVDQPVGDQNKTLEMFPSKVVVPLRDKKGFSSDTRITDSARVLGEDVASPAELAKAYMVSRPSKVSPSLVGFHKQLLRGDTTPLINPFTSESQIKTAVQSLKAPAAFPENGFPTPRSQGRSAIYTMARTPYSRFQSATILQGAGTAVDSHGGPSSSTSHDARRNDKSPGSRHRTLKRRCSVLDNDIGAVGPVRRIRQKASLLPAASIVSVCGARVSADTDQQQSLTAKAVLPVEVSTENGDNGSHGCGFSSFPSQSSEAASKTLQQLDALVSSKEKVPTKLSLSMLCGGALRSLENVDSSNIFDHVLDSSTLDVQHRTSSPITRDPISQKQSKVKEDSLKKSIISYDKSTLAVDVVNTKSVSKSAAHDTKTTASSVINCAPQNPPVKKRAFRMSVHEDYLELDDGDYPNGPFTLPDAGGKFDANLLENKNSDSETSRVEKPSAISEVKSPATFILSQKTVGTSEASAITERSSGLLFPAGPLPSATVQQPKKDKQAIAASDKGHLPKELSLNPSVSLGDGVASVKESNSFPAASNFAFNPAENVSQFNYAASSLANNATVPQFSLPSNSKLEVSSSLNVVSVPATDSVKRVLPESDKNDSKSSLNDGVLSCPSETDSSVASTSSPTSSIISFGGIPVGNSRVTNGFLGSAPIFPSTSVSSSSPATASSTANATDCNSMPVSAPIFKFISPSVSPPLASLPPISAVEPTEAEANAKMSSNNLSSDPVSGTSSALANAGSNLFGTSSSVLSGGSIFGVTFSTILSTGSSVINGTSSGTGSSVINGTSSGTGSGIFGLKAGTSKLPVADQPLALNLSTAITSQTSMQGASVATLAETSTKPLPFQFGSSVPSPSGLAGNSTFSSGSSLLTSSTSNATLFSSGPSLGLPSTMPSSEACTISSSASTTSVLFASSWQTPNLSVFGTASNTSASTGFVFGTSATSNAVTNSTPGIFGSSTNALSGSPFAFSSPMASTQLQPAFDNSNPGFTVGSSPSVNSDQMNMEDSMAEDMVQATQPPTLIFGQQPMPTSSGFNFGSTTPTGVNQFGAAAPPGPSLFQFGGQLNMTTPSNPSPFQASGSLEFTTGGSFSLGTGGGDKSGRRYIRVKKPLRKK